MSRNDESHRQLSRWLSLYSTSPAPMAEDSRRPAHRNRPPQRRQADHTNLLQTLFQHTLARLFKTDKLSGIDALTGGRIHQRIRT